MPYQAEKEASAKRWTYTVVFAVLVSGAVAALAAKTLYQIHTDSCQGAFQKPFFLTCAMFIGEAMCLLYYHLFVSPTTSFAARRHRREQALLDSQSSGQIQLLDEEEIYNPSVNQPSDVYNPSVNEPSDEESTPSLPSVPVWFFLILCTFDLTASTLSFIGLLWITNSLSLMFRGSMAVFVALFSVCLLRRRLAVVQWISIAIVVAGLATVGFSSYLKPKGDDDANSASGFEIALGIILTLASSVLNAFQNVIEELLMKMLSNYAEPHPLQIVGWEGIFGTMLSAFVMLPIVNHVPGGDCNHVQEDSIDTLKQFKDPLVFFLVIAYIFGLAFMNYFSMELSRLLSAVVRNLVSAVRTVVVWGVSVMLYYAVGSSYGEQVGLWSIVEACGFVLLIGGSVLYSKAKEKQLPAKGEQAEYEESSDLEGISDPDYQQMIVDGETHQYTR